MRRWPAYTIAGFVGLFCTILGTVLVWDHVVRGAPIDATGWIIVIATALRGLSILIALAAVQSWGRHLPPALLSVGLWGCAGAQLIYPAVATVVKLAIIAGLIDVSVPGLSDVTAVGWFNFAMVWLVFGLPGALFIVLARDHQRRHGLTWLPIAVGLGGGVGVMFGIGTLIG